MQLDALILYNRDGEQRRISFDAGELNIITGDSRTGKSSLINIIRFCLGSDNPHTPYGPIQRSVAWYGLLAHVGETRSFIGRPAPEGDSATSATMLLVGADDAPAFDELVSNTTNEALRQYLGGLLGIEDNLNVPGVGQTRQRLSATFVHSLYYCFQGQGEVANPNILFHRQGSEWQPQTIRDTLPFFLGAQGLEDLRRREQLAERRRELRRAEQRRRAALAELEIGLDRAGALLSEARDVDLWADEQTPPTLAEARRQLQAIIDVATQAASPTGGAGGGEFARLTAQRRDLRDALRENTDQLRALDEYARVGDDYAGELAEQQARLASIGLIPTDATDEASCALCGRQLEDDSGARGRGERQLRGADRRLAQAHRDLPRIAAARDELLQSQRSLRTQAKEVDDALDALARNDEAVARHREMISVQSYVRGRIALYLDSTELVEDAQLAALTAQVESLTAQIEELEALVDPQAIRSRVVSALATVSRQMSRWGERLGLEHAEQGARIDYDRLTIVADTDEGPAYMDRGEIGSGMNWVGYHLTAYLALQQFFITRQRPVPHFVVLDQPSQAFFPPDRESGGDLSDLDDTDRENTRRLYELMRDVVTELNGELQIIALDHADFDDDWFAESVIERWRGGKALIPSAWLADSADEEPA